MPSGQHFPGGNDDEGGPPSEWSMYPSRFPPALRCGHVKKDGTRCKRWAQRGSGYLGTKPRCPSHTRMEARYVSNPRRKEVLRAAKLVEKLGGPKVLADANRARLLLIEPDMIDVLESLAKDPDVSNRDRIAAAGIAERAAERVREGPALAVTVNNVSVTVDAGARVKELLDRYAAAAAAPPRRVIAETVIDSSRESGE